MAKNNWTKKQTIVAFNVYCKIPFKSSNKTHPTIIKYANLIGRSPSALNMKVGNFGRLDPELKKQGISGLKNGSKLEEIVWDEFHGNWDELAFESEKIIAEFDGKQIDDYASESFPEGKEIERTVKGRVNQSFFRSAVLSAYNQRCCITGLDIPELLVASHIVPWRKNIERTNPRNGLSLNSLHDKAFDKGLITINENYEVIVSETVYNSRNEAVISYLKNDSGKKINLPDKFLPKQEFLKFHRDSVFIK